MVTIDKSKESRRILVYILFTFFIVVLVLPVITLFKEAFFIKGEFVGLNNFIDYFSTPYLFKSIGNSIFVSSISSSIVVLLSFTTAYAIERSKIKFKKIVRFILMLPLFIPTMTHAISLIYLFGENGLITTGFFGAIPNIAFKFPLYGKWGVIIAESLYIFPAIFIMFSVSLKSCDYKLYEAARMLDTSNFRMFKTITLPSVKYTIVSALLAGFTMVFSDFGIPKVLGGNYNLLATDIYKQVIGQSNIAMGATVGILLIIPSIIYFLVDQNINKDINTIDTNDKVYIINDNKKRDLILGTITYFICTIIIIVIATVIIAAFIEQWPYNLNLTTKWFSFNNTRESASRIFMHSIFIAIISGVLGTILAILTAYITERGIGFDRMRKFIDWISVIPLAIPGLVIGLSYLIFFNKYNNPMKFIYGTFIIMIFANIVHFFSVPYINIKSEMKKISKEYEEVSETMGIPWYKVFDSTILPLSKVAIIESFQYLFLNSMMTLSALVFLYNSKTKVASVEMIFTYDEGSMASTAAIGTMILSLNLIVKFIIEIYKNNTAKNKREKYMEIYKVIQIINEREDLTQRKIAEQIGISLGKVNYIIKECIKSELIEKVKFGKVTKYRVTEKGFEQLRENISLIKEEKILISKDLTKNITTGVILAAGQRTDFDVSPAGLKIKGTTVIKQTINNLKQNGINNIIIVVGYGKEIIVEDLNDDKDVTIIENINYSECGSMGSLSLVGEYIKDDFILIEGDVVFEQGLLKELVNSSKRDCLLITNISGSGDEEFVQVKNNFLYKLGKDIHQFNRVDGEFVGISKISLKLFELIMREYKDNINIKLNYEYIILDVARDFRVSCLKVNDFIWSEIDNSDQYHETIKKFSNK